MYLVLIYISSIANMVKPLIVYSLITFSCLSTLDVCVKQGSIVDDRTTHPV